MVYTDLSFICGYSKGCAPSKSDTCGPTLILPGYCATFNITDGSSNALPKNEKGGNGNDNFILINEFRFESFIS